MLRNNKKSPVRAAANGRRGTILPGQTSARRRGSRFSQKKIRRRSIVIADGAYAVGSVILRETSCSSFLCLQFFPLYFNFLFYVPERLCDSAFRFFWFFDLIYPYFFDTLRSYRFFFFSFFVFRFPFIFKERF